MARKTEAPRFVEDILVPEEIELFEYARSGDWFIRDGFLRYGEDWPAYIPRSENGQPIINVALQYLFGWQLQDFQAPLYYCPIQDIMLHGGRGASKSEALAIVFATRTAFTPGYNWLHTAPSIEQSKYAYDIILEKGGASNFSRIFLQHTRVAPAPDIELRPWNEFDPGTKFFFRSQGGHGGKPMELLRSLTAGYVTSDESFRINMDDYFVRILTGIARGPNWYTLNSDPALKQEYDERVFEMQTETNPRRRRALQKSLDAWVVKKNVTKRTVLMLTGNAGPWAWEWIRYKWGKNNPDKRWSMTWTSAMNAYFDEDQKGLLRQQFLDDPDGLRVEMDAERPRAVGDVFVQDHLDNLFDNSLTETAVAAVEEEAPGWKFIKHEEYGLVHYEKPPEQGAAYAVGGDPGTGRVPNRNKWCNIVARIDARPFEIVYFHVGNVSRVGQGSIRPWIADCKYILQRYPMPEGHFAAEAGGTQKNVHEVVWPEDLQIVPLNMNVIKPTLIMQAQLLLQSGLFVSPLISLLEQELSGYQILDKKLPQDTVMALLALTNVVWPYVADMFQMPEPKEEEEYWEEPEYFFREVRDRRREVRTR